MCPPPRDEGGVGGAAERQAKTVQTKNSLVFTKMCGAALGGRGASGTAG